MRLIDADALRKDLFVAITTQKRWMDGAQKSNSGTLFQLAQQAYFTLLECKQHLEKAPTIETPTQPQVVHCKDCKHRHIEGHTWSCPFGLAGGPEFFCGYGADMRETDED